MTAMESEDHPPGCSRGGVRNALQFRNWPPGRNEIESLLHVTLYRVIFVELLRVSGPGCIKQLKITWEFLHIPSILEDFFALSLCFQWSLIRLPLICP